jgi:preprotein translocase subunit SecD
MRRLAALSTLVLLGAGALGGCASSGDGDASRNSTTTVGSAPIDDRGITTTTARGPGRIGDLEPSDLQFRAVLELRACDAGTTAPSGPGPSSAQASDEEELPSRDGLTCYLVGPVSADGGDVARAVARPGDTGGWSVGVTIKGSSRARLNELFNACYRSTPACPSTAGPDNPGAVAIVLDGEVRSAPSVNGEDLADQAFTISGSFTEGEARDLADALNG